MLMNYPSSTPFKLAVPLWNIRVEVWKYNYKVREPSQQYPLKSGSTLLKHLIEGMKTWLQSWGTIPAVPPSIWQYPLKTLEWICENLITKLGNYPSSTGVTFLVRISHFSGVIFHWSGSSHFSGSNSLAPHFNSQFSGFRKKSLHIFILNSL